MIHPKVFNATVAAAISVIIVWAVQSFGKVTIPAEVAAALTTILAAIGGYLTPSPAAPSPPGA